MRLIRGLLLTLTATTLLLSGCNSSGNNTGSIPAEDPDSVRKTNYGEVIGFKGIYGSHAWLGIPYAKAPIGNLRWRAPIPPLTWKVRKKALAFGEFCPQSANQSGGVTHLEPGTLAGSEDCLYLNIWAPVYNPQKVPKGKDRLPVMVWIHGGGNEIGHSGLYNGGNLAVTGKVIVVSMNYRLGPFGWFFHRSIRDSAIDDFEKSGNFGTLDLIRALKWVQNNIKHFGGDPGNVTVFGQSAGGYNVFALLVSPLAKGLFHKAISQSGGAAFSTKEQAEKFDPKKKFLYKVSSNEALARLIIEDKKAADKHQSQTLIQKMSDNEIADYLRNKSQKTLLKAFVRPSKNQSLPPRVRVFSNIMDGKLIPKADSSELMKDSENFNAVPLILGTNKDEQKLFMAFDPFYITKYFKIIYRINDEEVFNRDAAYISDAWKVKGADKPASAISTSSDQKVFVYRFDWDEEPDFIVSDFSKILGASHGFEIPFVFGHFDLNSRLANLMISNNKEEQQILSSAMMSYWAEFAYTGTPGQGRNGNLPVWINWDNTPGKPKMMIFDTQRDKGIRMSQEQITLSGVIQRLESDSTFESRRKRCKIYSKMFHGRFEWDQETYNTLSEAGCKEFDPIQLKNE